MSLLSLMFAKTITLYDVFFIAATVYLGSSKFDPTVKIIIASGAAGFVVGRVLKLTALLAGGLVFGLAMLGGAPSRK